MRELTVSQPLPCPLALAKQLVILDLDFALEFYRNNKDITDLTVGEWQKTSANAWQRTVIYSVAPASVPFLQTSLKAIDKVLVKTFESLVTRDTQATVTARTYFENFNNLLHSSVLQLQPSPDNPATSLCTISAKCQYTGNLLRDSVEASMETYMTQEYKRWLVAAKELCTKESLSEGSGQNELTPNDESNAQVSGQSTPASPRSTSPSLLRRSGAASPVKKLSEDVIRVSKDIDELRFQADNNLRRLVFAERALEALLTQLSTARSQAEETRHAEASTRKDLILQVDAFTSQIRTQLDTEDKKLSKDEIIREARFEDIRRRIERMLRLKSALLGSWKHVLAFVVFLGLWPLVMRYLWTHYGRYWLKRLLGLLDMFFRSDAAPSTEGLRKVTGRVRNDLLRLVHRRG